MGQRRLRPAAKITAVSLHAGTPNRIVRLTLMRLSGSPTQTTNKGYSSVSPLQALVRRAGEKEFFTFNFDSALEPRVRLP